MSLDDKPNILRTIRLEEITVESLPSSPERPRRPSYLVEGTFEDKRVLVKKYTPGCRYELLKERASTWCNLRHPNVVGICAISFDSEEPSFVVLPYHENANVKEWVAGRGEVDRNQLVLDVAFGMQYLHAHDIVHGCLIPTNILINQFGRACVSDYDTLELQPSRNHNAHRYSSPEAWKGAISQPSDVFSFAMCAYELYSSSLPWGVLPENRIYRLLVLEDARPDRPDPEIGQRNGLTDNIWSLIEEAWAKEVRLRPTFDIILRMWEQQSPEGPTYQAEENTSQNAHRHETYSTISHGPPAYDDTPQEIEEPEPSPGYADYTRVTGPPNPPAESHQALAAEDGPIASTSQLSSSGPQTASSAPGTSSETMVQSSTGRGFANASPAASLEPLQVTPKKSFLSFYSSTSSGTSQSAPAARRHFSIDSSLDYRDAQRPRSISSFSNIESDLLRTLPVMSRSQSVQMWEDHQRYYSSAASTSQHTRDIYSTPHGLLDTIADVGSLEDQVSAGHSIRSNSQSSSRSTIGARPSALLLVQALQAEMREGRKMESIDGYLIKMYESALESDKEAFKLVNTGAVPLLIHLLRTRAADEYGVELILIVLGILAHDSISANTIYRTGTAVTLIELANAAPTDEVETLAIWCLTRISRSVEVAQGLIKLNLIPILHRITSRPDLVVPNIAVYCVGTLIQSDGLAELVASMGFVDVIANHLRLATASPIPNSEAICSGIYAMARLSRSIKLAKAIARAGCIELIGYHLKNSNDANVLHWSARAVGCLMRPNSSDMAKILLDADIARGLARLPTVLPADALQPLGSFGFAIQRFSCAEWGSSTRKALVEAGVVDSLLAALRTAAEEYCFDVHVELALAISLLGDIGGTSIRKEIVSAGGLDILRSVAKKGGPEVGKACNLAIASVNGNLFSRNAASAKTAMAHNWNGGCPDYYPSCPLAISIEDEGLGSEPE